MIYFEPKFSIEKAENIIYDKTIKQKVEEKDNNTFSSCITTQAKDKSQKLEFFTYNKIMNSQYNNKLLKIITQKNDNSVISSINKSNSSSFIESNIFESIKDKNNINNKNKTNISHIKQENIDLLKSDNSKTIRRDENEFINSINKSSIIFIIMNF